MTNEDKQTENDKRTSVQNPLQVVLDTNIIFEYRRLTGPNIDLFAQFLKRTGSTLVVPELVFRESVKGFGRETAKKLEDILSSTNKLDGLIARKSGGVLPTVSVAEALAEYEEYLAGRLIDLGGERPPFLTIPLADIVERALVERRPFMGKDRGIRDAVIWETILREVAVKGEKVVLISNDNGFTDDQGKLHPDLQADLEKQALPNDSVAVLTPQRT